MIDTQKLKTHLQYCAYRLNEHIPAEFDELFAEEQVYSVTLIDSHGNKHHFPHIYADNIDTAMEITSNIIKKYLPATTITFKEVFER